jgi:hypothetical protein
LLWNPLKSQNTVVRAATDVANPLRISKGFPQKIDCTLSGMIVDEVHHGNMLKKRKDLVTETIPDFSTTWKVSR